MNNILNSVISVFTSATIAAASPLHPEWSQPETLTPTPVNEVQIPLGEDYEVAGINWSRNGETLIFYRVVQIDGRTAICGAFFSKGPVPGIVQRDLLKTARIRSGNTLLRTNLIYFKKLDPEVDTTETAKLDCRFSRKAWRASYANNLSLKIRSGTYEY
ncbi:hypothetical protein [Pseudaestuariivita rosea]|uniref:hypothetical protein n=1 Tax=Pseudaestuariivita rosea TaxID=2763263 RepID=UPI001ABAC61A|nr:hypothetical protein [Pseudaestuariivita rosea]